jgi:hypothetical protein
MSSFIRSSLPLLLLVVSSCAEPQVDAANVPDNGQTYRNAIATICAVDAAVGAGSDTGVLELAERRHEYLQAHVKHPDGIYFYTLFRTQGPKEQSAALEKEAARVKLESCALGDTLAAEAAAG